ARRTDLRLRLPHRHALLETSQRNGESQFAGDLRPCRPEGRDEIHIVAEKAEVFGQDTDHGDRLLVDREILADHGRIAVEVTLPQTVRDHDDGGGVIDLVLVFRIEATQGGFCTVELEDRGRESPTVDPLSGRTVLFRAETLADAREGSHPFE